MLSKYRAPRRHPFPASQLVSARSLIYDIKRIKGAIFRVAPTMIPYKRIDRKSAVCFPRIGKVSPYIGEKKRWQD
jgi:hypothetical protein